MTPEKQLEELVNNEELKEYGKGRSPCQDAFREFRRNKIAVGGMIFIVIHHSWCDLCTSIHTLWFCPAKLDQQPGQTFTGYDITTDFAEENCHWYNTPLEWGCTTLYCRIRCPGKGSLEPDDLWHAGFPGSSLGRCHRQFGHWFDLWHDLRFCWWKNRYDHDASSGFPLCEFPLCRLSL